MARSATPAARNGTALDEAQDAIRLADLDPAQAVPVAVRAVRRAHREQDTVALAIAERAWGHALLLCGELDSAIRHLRRSVACGVRMGLPALVGEARMKLSYALMYRGRSRDALTEIDAALLVLDGAAAARAQAQRAVLLHLAGHLDEALAQFQAVVPIIRRTGDLLSLERTLIGRAFLHADRHAFTSARTDLLEAERLARRLGKQLAVGIIAANFGYVETLRGDVPAALAHFDRAEQISGAHGGQLGTIYQDRAELLLSAGLAEEAQATAEHAIIAHQKDHRLLKVPEARLLLAQAAFLDRAWPTAHRHAHRARREFSRQQRVEWAELARLATLRTELASGGCPRIPMKDVETMVGVLTASGWPAAGLEARLVAARLAIGRGRDGAGRAYLAQAGQGARRHGPAALRARSWYAQALLRWHTGDLRGAVGAARTGLRILDEHRTALGATDLQVHSAVHRTELTELGLRIALDDGKPRRVLEWAERGRASQLRHRPLRPPDDPELAGLLSDLRTTAHEIDRLREAGRSTARPVQRQVTLERRIRDHCRLHRGVRDPLPAPVSPSVLGQALGDCALVEFVQFDGLLQALSVVDGRLRLRRLGPLTRTLDLLDRLPFALHRLAGRHSRTPALSGARALLQATAAELDATLLGPLPEVGDRPLVVVPTGALHSLPWSILPSCIGRPVSVSPSATLWCSTTQRHSRNRAGALDEAAGGTVTGRPAVTGGVAVAAGPKLTGAREEARAVAAIHRTTALVDDAATVEAVLASLTTAGTAHLAAHGHLSAQNPLFSSLLLSDGPLVVYDLEQLAQVPPTVVLAACDSGRSVVRAGDELLGLSAAFIARGAAELIASVLPIPDAETTPLMVAFHRQLAAGRPAAIALATAQQQMGRQEPAAIAAAAGFVCIGAGFIPRSGHPDRSDEK